VALRIEGYVIISADGMLADARNVMPDQLRFEGDKAFFTSALDRADLILHGRNSYEDQPNSPRRRRIFLTRKIEADPEVMPAVERTFAERCRDAVGGIRALVGLFRAQRNDRPH
jgi:hypothetical protein